MNDETKKSPIGRKFGAIDLRIEVTPKEMEDLENGEYDMMAICRNCLTVELYTNDDKHRGSWCSSCGEYRVFSMERLLKRDQFVIRR